MTINVTVEDTGIDVTVEDISVVADVETAPVDEQMVKDVIGMDSEGNMNAHVGMRVDTVDNLIMVSDAEDGEVAIASDAESMIVYKKIGIERSNGVSYNRSQHVGGFNVTSDILVPVNGVVTHVPFASVANDRYSLVDVVEGTFTIPVLAIGGISERASIAEIKVVMRGFAPSAATFFQFELQYYDGSSWLSYDKPVSTLYAHPSGQAARVVCDLYAGVSISAFYTDYPQRVTIKHNDPAPVALLGNIDAKFSNPYEGYEVKL